MTVGTLTFHISANYGAQLQSYAMKRVLQSLGHTVVFVNRLDGTMARMLDAEHLQCSSRASIKTKIVNWIFRMLWIDGTTYHARAQSTVKFAGRHFPCTEFSFSTWEEVGVDKLKSTGIDALIVGSDQVWNCEWMDPSVFLLEGAPSVCAIAYAASFGMRKIPDSSLTRYAEGFKRFSAISTREREGVGLVESAGGTAVHVCDPTLLLNSGLWAELIGSAQVSSGRKIIMYFISHKWNDELCVIDAFARRHDIEVAIFLGSARIKKLRPIRKLWSYVKESWYARRGRVRIKESAGADEFVRQLAYADGVVTDSFHALMLSAVFHRNVRVITPKDSGRMGMFARIEEFAYRCVKGTWQSDDIASALSSMESKQMSFDDDAISEFREWSLEWLKNALTIK